MYKCIAHYARARTHTQSLVEHVRVMRFALYFTCAARMCVWLHERVLAHARLHERLLVGTNHARVTGSNAPVLEGPSEFRLVGHRLARGEGSNVFRRHQRHFLARGHRRAPDVREDHAVGQREQRRVDGQRLWIR